MISKNDKYHNLYMNIAWQCAKMSYCKRRQVGALIVKHDRIISMGWNGMPKGSPNDCEDGNITKPEVLHAEANAIVKLTQTSETSLNGILYTTTSPCLECSKLILQTGIHEIYYAQEYKDLAGIDFLLQHGIMVNHFINKDSNDTRN